MIINDELLEKYGLPVAFAVEYLRKIVSEKGEIQEDGKAWVGLTQQELAKEFEGKLNPRRVKLVFRQLVELDLIEADNIKKHSLNMTKFYRVK